MTANLRAGDWVEVRSKAEILATLDRGGRIDNLPFMPEMFQYCGQRLRIFKSAHKTCDTVNSPSQGRRMSQAIHLEGARCDGQAHGGCQALCLLFWKEAWVRPVDGPGPLVRLVQRATRADERPSLGSEARGCAEQDVVTATRVEGDADDVDPTYVCQATMLPQATGQLPWWNLRQYLDDFTSGNVSLLALARGAAYASLYQVIKRADRSRFRRSLPPTLIRLYDAWQSLVGGVPYPRRRGTIPAGQKTPQPVPLLLKPGELVRVKSYEEILATLDTDNKNRGLLFDAEEVPYCGKTFRVRSVVSRIVDERTGKMRHFKGQSVILEGVWCKGHYSYRRMFCPRAIYSFWREAWLERVEEQHSQPRLAADSAARGVGESP
jgi:hypothetical protein